jgi:hypothetical protein
VVAVEAGASAMRIWSRTNVEVSAALFPIVIWGTIVLATLALVGMFITSSYAWHVAMACVLVIWMMVLVGWAILETS